MTYHVWIWKTVLRCGDLIMPPMCMTFDCCAVQNELDHSVMLVGYGTTDSEYGSSSVGEDYWGIKNEWSAYWGDGGYVRISRDHHGCGIVSDAVYAIVEPTDSHHSKHGQHSHRLQRADPRIMEA